MDVDAWTCRIDSASSPMAKVNVDINAVGSELPLTDHSHGHGYAQVDAEVVAVASQGSQSVALGLALAAASQLMD